MIKGRIQRVDWCFAHRAPRLSTAEAQSKYCYRWSGKATDECAIESSLVISTETDVRVSVAGGTGDPGTAGGGGGG